MYTCVMSIHLVYLSTRYRSVKVRLLERRLWGSIIEENLNKEWDKRGERTAPNNILTKRQQKLVFFDHETVL